ncbi:hypothetical protein E2C01_094729 [Portunus trituberculatus]|uniref:Uncharacterized protein n=1 Tax=Portunus trituberculatus TaxID=210409 RepID=A0A5B7JT51_PORTR|nr:hypothetical protein [Portunus trituberculatus]
MPSRLPPTSTHTKALTLSLLEFELSCLHLFTHSVLPSSLPGYSAPTHSTQRQLGRTYSKSLGSHTLQIANIHKPSHQISGGFPCLPQGKDGSKLAILWEQWEVRSEEEEKGKGRIVWWAGSGGGGGGGGGDSDGDGMMERRKRGKEGKRKRMEGKQGRE